MCDITSGRARRSGLNGVVDLLETTGHGVGERVLFAEVHYMDKVTRSEPRALTHRV